MKKVILTLIAASISVVLYAQKISVKGSDTVLPLTQKVAESYMKKNAGSSVTVVGGGSGVGIAALMDNTTDIAMSSRKIKMDERLKMQDAGRAYKEVIVANDALAVIVNNSNKVSQLTREQIEGIYTGKIKNWKEVGGEDMVIVIYSRESSSGTYEFFKDQVMARKNYASNVLSMPATGAIIQSISQTKGAIGYVGLAYLNKEVKALSVSYDKGKTFVSPSLENAKNKSYPVVRPLFYYYPTAKEKQVMPFVNFILSAEGQDFVSKVGYIPVK
ncbi:MAG: phosphate ABC transporter substrate-binding protein PstS family protein [Bacteroidetes bacterium]|nr:MAG: phosphate ABC transporter substrate-binding protein PstS family protein [Bacteroidota bacterium]REJ99816.1 MAG: phosphate ABC transporter substrate-binding protein PstS family protein [Bacteroidota bacterium]REK34189.1 MAG: phosphate ABC transporter substrate-binding protein PstS family protein [Bacteroidota bacterium]REK50519.1 MAG: phosphate ABC transporter substrate-binding protein PstS family protein [Bacteroidota bacterium]